jgi:YesN/AraC family two-component response regulator
MEMEKDIRKHMEASMRRLANQVRFAQNEQYLSKQYDDQSTVSKGIFYDKSK